MKLPTIYFLRHGETQWNVEKRIQGQLDSPLTAQGVRDAQAQARLLTPILADNPPCYASPLGRTRQTADIALSGHSYTVDDRLSEAHAGTWQGMLRDQARRDHPELVSPDISALELFLVAPGGEGYAAFEARILDFVQNLTEPTVVVSHGLLGQVLRGLILGKSREEMSALSNLQGCVYVLHDGQETVIRETVPG